MIFVSDEIPTELRCIVEFLNQQMDPAEVLAVEVKQYVSQNSDFKTLVPRVIGQMVEAGPPRKGRTWDETSFFQELESEAPQAVGPARAIFKWATSETSRIVWGKGKQYGTFSSTLDHKGAEHRPIQVWTGDYLYVQFGDMRSKPPFDDELKRTQVLRRLNEIPGVAIPDEATTKYPTFPLSALRDEAALRQFLGVLDRFVQKVRES